MRTFRSDNNAGLCPEALQAIIDADRLGHQVGYGDDECTARALSAFRDIFGEEVGVFFVPTGTIANGLAVACLTRPWQRVLCHANSHWSYDESTAPERFTGCRTTEIHAKSSRLTPEDIERATPSGRGDVHQPQPGALTISNPTEFGEVYSPDETAALCEAAHALGYRVHVDGARFANAVAHLGCDPRDITSRAGVDALSFGGTKNGLAFGEAVIFFPQDDRAAFERATLEFPHQRKTAGALLSKHRFVSAPFEATLTSGAWLRHAAHANAMAEALARGLRELNIGIPHRVQSNGVFAELPAPVCDALRAAGQGFYPFEDPSGRMLSRLMCSFDTQPEDVESFLGAVRTHAAKR